MKAKAGRSGNETFLLRLNSDEFCMVDMMVAFHQGESCKRGDSDAFELFSAVRGKIKACVYRLRWPATSYAEVPING